MVSAGRTRVSVTAMCDSPAALLRPFAAAQVVVSMRCSGATLIALPMKIRSGGGAPVSTVALLP